MSKCGKGYRVGRGGGRSDNVDKVSGASKNDYIVLNGTVRFKIICMFLGGLVSGILFLVGMR